MDFVNIVTNREIIDYIKRNSKYFKVNLGFSATVEDKSGERILSHKDEFAYSYNVYYKTIIYAQGNIGKIRFYTDHQILEKKIAVYLELEEFLYEFDVKEIEELGNIDNYLGKIIGEVEEKVKKIKEEKDIKDIKEEDYKKGDADKIFKNPGAVSYEDLKEYLRRKNSNRI